MVQSILALEAISKNNQTDLVEKDSNIFSKKFKKPESHKGFSS